MNEEHFKKVTEDLLSFAKSRLGYDKDPDVRYVRDQENAKALLGYTAHYNPTDKAVTVFISGRHPKDILRSVAHELVHHAQCCRGDLDNIETPEGYAQKDPHMRKMEAEAYLKGNLIFRDWEDEAKANNKIVTIKIIGENKMTKKDFIGNIAAAVSEILENDEDINEGSMKKTSRFKEGDRVQHKEKKKGTGRVVSRGGAHPNNVGVLWSTGQESHDHSELVKIKEVNELTEIKKKQSSIDRINNIKLNRINEALMAKLIK